MNAEAINTATALVEALAEVEPDTRPVSHNSLKTFGHSVGLYYGIYVAKTIERPASTPAMKLGQAVNYLVLDPEHVSNFVAVGPTATRRADKWQTWEAALPKHVTAVTADEYDEARRIADAVGAHPLARELLDARGAVEGELTAVDSDTGMVLLGRLDKLFEAGHIVDLKSTNDPSPDGWSRKIAQLGYHRQAAFYEDLRDLVQGAGVGHFWHIVVGTDEPYEVAVYELDERSKEFGRMQNRTLLAELKRCRETNDWSGRWSRDVQIVGLPGWAYKGEGL